MYKPMILSVKLDIERIFTFTSNVTLTILSIKFFLIPRKASLFVRWIKITEVILYL